MSAQSHALEEFEADRLYAERVKSFPEKIYLNDGDDLRRKYKSPWCDDIGDEVVWSVDSQEWLDVEYVRADLVEALKAKVALLDGVSQDAIDGGWTAKGLIAYANGLEVRLSALLSQVEALTKDAERWRWGSEHAAWLRGESAAFIAIPVLPNADLSCRAMREDAIDAAIEAAKK